ncbi:MAG TPA: hypothetical protein VD833_12795 [Vicinamibacterales bacterium]|nr:hypothetical protein [Vicinamibacterales bacterium]
MAAKVRTWVWVVVAIAAIGILGLVTMAGVGIYFFSRHFEMREASAASAATEFEAIRDRFKEDDPLVQLDDRGRFLKASRPATPRPDGRPHQLSVLVFDPEKGGRIVRIDIPFWLLRLKLGGTTIDFNGNRMELEDMKLTVEDLERLGPSLIVDHATPDGERVLVWSH